jgi:hypothetical protein
MARLAPAKETLIALFAKSGNVCAYPGCTHELVTPRNLFVGQICHIEAANAGGQRYNAESSDEQRRSFENLLLLCYRHHKETDDISVFDVLRMREMKHRHECKHGEKPFKVNEAFLHRLEVEMQSYWDGIATSNRENHVSPEFAVRLRVGVSAVEQFDELDKSVQRLVELFTYFSDCDLSLNEEIRAHLKSLKYDLTAYDSVPYFQNPFFNRSWEMHALAANNTLTDMVVTLKQVEVRFLEEYVKTHSNESDAITALEAAKQELQNMAVSAGYAD